MADHGVDSADVPSPNRLPMVAGLLAAWSLVWFVASFATLRGPALIGWLPMPASALLAVVACRRAARVVSDRYPDAAGAAAARFWRHLGLVGLVMAATAVSQARDSLAPAGPPVQTLGSLTTALSGLEVLVAMWALLRVPVSKRSRTEWLTLGLDAGIVVVAAALFAWHFSIRTTLTDPTPAVAPALTLALVGLGFVCAVGTVKIVFAGAGAVDRKALHLFAGTIVLASVLGSLGPLLDSRPWLSVAQLITPQVGVGMALAADRQRNAAPPSRPRRRRPYSVLPYVAVIATDGLLLTAARESDGPILLAGAVALTAIVMVRQLMALAENASLLARVDASLLTLGRREQRFRSLVQNAADAVFVTDERGIVSYASPGLERLLGIGEAELLGRSVQPLVHPEDLPKVWERTNHLLGAPGQPLTGQLRARHADGSWRWLEITVMNLLDDPSVRGIVNNARDMTETRRIQDELSHQASHDELTQLANRALFTRRTARALAEAGDGLVTVALIDLDDFKTVNDRLGHAVGDALLVAVAQRIKDCVRPGDTVARLGGDEFALLLQDVRTEDGTWIAGRVTSGLAEPLCAAGHELLIQASIGLAERRPGVDAAELLRSADVAMYAAKESGKGRYARYEPQMDIRAVEHARMGAELRQALDRKEFTLLYQPIVALPSGRISGVEALVRWEHPQRGMISPYEFIPAAERTGLIVPMGRWILREACEQAVRWTRQHGSRAPGTVSVNVSARQLREQGFATELAAILVDTGVDPQRVVIEVTETAVFDGGPALDALNDAHSLGVRMALDDFGTGHSSLGLLRTCPVDILKVDKSFVDEVTGTAEQAAIATSIIQIAHAMRLVAVAEGVETKAQADRLHQLGYRLAQGYYFFKPLPAAQIDTLLAEPRAEATSLVS